MFHENPGIIAKYRAICDAHKVLQSSYLRRVEFARGNSVALPQTLVHWLLAASAAGAIVFFAVGLTSYFDRPRHRPAWVRVIHTLGTVLSLTQLALVLALPPRGDTWASVGIVLYTGAVTVFLSAIESARRTRLQRAFIDEPLPDRLIADGPYRWVRHPFYLGYIMGALAAPIAIDSLALVVIAAIMIAISVAAAIHEERVWLNSPHGEAYRAYRRRTGMFIPFVG
jgi:protein-S-isoprenylcysteine O-methyltransferase Ste14